MSVQPPTRLAVLLSGTGTNLRALLDAIAADPDFGAEVVVVGADVADAEGLERAHGAGIATVVQQVADHPDRSAWEDALRADLEKYDVAAVVLAGFMRILTGTFLSRWPGRVINTHPSLLPAFRGPHAVRDALTWGVKVTGCTVHIVDEEVDHGPIVAQHPIDIRPDDTEETLHARIKAVEHELLPACVRLLCHDRLEIRGRHVFVRT